MNGGQNDLTLANLPLRAFRNIPQPRPDALRVTGLVRDKGKVTGYQLSDGQILNKAQGVRVASDGGIIGVGVASRKGELYLKSLPNADAGDNLSKLPTVYN